MVDRRSVLKASAATMAGALLRMPVSGRNLSPMPSHIAFQRAIFDERLAGMPSFCGRTKKAHSILPSADSRRCCHAVV